MPSIIASVAQGSRNRAEPVPINASAEWFIALAPFPCLCNGDPPQPATGTQVPWQGSLRPPHVPGPQIPHVPSVPFQGRNNPRNPLTQCPKLLSRVRCLVWSVACESHQGRQVQRYQRSTWLSQSIWAHRCASLVGASPSQPYGGRSHNVGVSMAMCRH